MNKNNIRNNMLEKFLPNTQIFWNISNVFAHNVLKNEQEVW